MRNTNLETYSSKYGETDDSKESFRELVHNLIRESSESEKDQLLVMMAIEEEYKEDPEFFYRSFVDINRLASANEKYKFMYEVLTCAVRHEARLVTQFFLNFSANHHEYEKTSFLSNVNSFLKNRQITGKKTGNNFLSQLKSEIFNLNSEENCPLLITAAKFGKSKEMVKLLLNEGADINATYTDHNYNNGSEDYGRYPTTAINEVIKNENLELFELFLQYPNINFQKALVRLGKDDIRMFENNIGKRRFLITKLLDQIENLEQLDDEGYNILHNFFCARGYNQILQILIDKKEGIINNKTATGDSLLHLAAKKNLIFPNLEALIKNGIEVNAQNNEGNTGLHLIVSCRTIRPDLKDKIRYLLENNADLGIKNNLGQTILDVAVDEAKEIIENFIFFSNLKTIITSKSKSEKEKIHLILAIYNANPEKFYELFFSGNYTIVFQYLSPYPKEMLSLSIKENSLKLTEFLFNLPKFGPKRAEKKEKKQLANYHRAISTSLPTYEEPLLHLASRIDMTGTVVGLFLDCMYSTNFDTNFNNNTALETAMKHDNRKAVVKIIEHKGFNSFSNLMRFFPKESLNNLELTIFVELLLRFQNPEQMQNSRYANYSLLHYTVGICRNKISMETLLMRIRLNLEQKSHVRDIITPELSFTRTYDHMIYNPHETLAPIHIAFVTGTPDTVELLLKFGAKPNSKTAFGYTPFDYTIHRLIPNISDRTNDNYRNLDIIIFKELEKTGFKEKVKILLRIFGTIYSENHDIGSKRCFDMYDTMRDFPNFWDQFDSILNSAATEIAQEKLAVVSTNDIKCQTGYSSDRSFEQRSPKRQKY